MRLSGRVNREAARGALPWPAVAVAHATRAEEHTIAGGIADLPALVAAMPNLAESSIGHELTADALKMGWSAAVKAYKAALAGLG